jgi:hypothetical protein
MPEPVSVVGLGLFAGYTMLQVMARGGSAVSLEARAVRETASALVESNERSVALFGGKSAALSELFALVHECASPGWNGTKAKPLSASASEVAAKFIRLFPDDLPLPEFAPEPNGRIALEWIVAPARTVSVSFGETHRLAFAWIDGIDSGYATVSFSGDTVPFQILSAIRGLVGNGEPSLRAA